MIEDFEVSIFLTETSTRHSLLYKQKTFRDTEKKGMQSNSSKLTGDTGDVPIEVEDGPVIAREESEEDAFNLDDLPEADDAESEDGLFVDEDEGQRGSKRPRAVTNTSSQSEVPQSKRRREVEGGDDKKKMAMDTTYDGFAIYGRVLCLVVKRKDKKGKAPVGPGGGQATMENWISSTQMPAEED